MARGKAKPPKNGIISNCCAAPITCEGRCKSCRRQCSAVSLEDIPEDIEDDEN